MCSVLKNPANACVCFLLCRPGPRQRSRFHLFPARFSGGRSAARGVWANCAGRLFKRLSEISSSSSRFKCCSHWMIGSLGSILDVGSFSFGLFEIGFQLPFSESVLEGGMFWFSLLALTGQRWGLLTPCAKHRKCDHFQLWESFEIFVRVYLLPPHSSN